MVLKCAFLVEKRFQDTHEPFLMEVKHLGPHRHTNKQSPTDIKIFLNSWALSLQLCNLITGTRIFFILNNETCIWTCWSPALTASHRTFHTMLLAAASSRSVAQLHLMFFSSSPGAGGRSVDLGKYPVSNSNRFHPRTYAWRLQSMLFHCWTWRNTL